MFDLKDDVKSNRRGQGPEDGQAEIPGRQFMMVYPSDYNLKDKNPNAQEEECDLRVLLHGTYGRQIALFDAK